MSQNSNTPSNGNSTAIALIVGALVALVAVLGWYVLARPSDDVTITIDGGGSALEDAAGAVENAVNGN
ncbi:hypothetical protein [Pararhodobacter zhoushanensis]|uniref:Uncharacterized protein n=1 Tax=Pararhodobacter zhoushanensis TaxID=2479545 RepID=A0ABT3GW78_9RHOB|nr:hypothetical protein [Pararhodobacter zhoushanensis]MCW1931799.1 hypothetical protein [Pararhodobacter zhoushanensis]